MGIQKEMDEELDVALMLAIDMGDVDGVINLIENYKKNTHRYKCPPKINECFIKSVEKESWPLTHLFLVKYHADVNAEKINNTRSRPIHIAARNGNVDIAKEILKQGSLVNIPNGEGKYPILLAVEQNHTEMVQLLVNEGAAINRSASVKNVKWEHPLHIAIKNNNWDIFDILVKKGARVNTVNYRGETCIHYAIKHQQFMLLQKLCERNADLNLGFPLRLAFLSNSFQMASTLIRYGAKVSTVNDKGESLLSDLPMVYKKDSNKDSDLHKFVYTKILSDSKHIINIRDCNDYTPLHHAATAGTIDIANMFIECGADINAAARPRRRTALYIAVGPGGCPELALTLMQKGARTDILPDSENLLNQLVLSASFDFFSPVQVELLDLLIKAGSEINCLDDRQCTPLERYILLSNTSFWAGHRETSLCNKEVIAIFVAAGARLGKKKQRPRSSLVTRQDLYLSPLCRVTWYGDFPTSRFLIDSGVNISKERWIHFQGRTKEVEDYLCELREVGLVPTKLMFLCRNAIRSRLLQCERDKDIRPSIENLPLPSSLISFLKLEKEIGYYLNPEE